MAATFTLRQMFVWSFVVAMAIPYVVAIMPDRDPPLRRFAIVQSDLQAWLDEADGAVEAIGIEATGDGHIWDNDYTLTNIALENDKLLDFLQRRVEQKILSEAWRITETTRSDNSVLLVMTDGHSHHRVYLIVTAQQPRQLKVLNIEYPSF